jgi:Spy/CpxP family protein refolding chaperone
MEEPMRISARAALVCALVVGAGAALAQVASPYVPLQGRELKAVAPERVAGLLEARGLGYALTAELNSYPGPMHVLELADQLGLTPEQADRARHLMDAMKAEGRVIGARIVEAETHLERMFRMGHIDQERLRAQTAMIGALDADLRRAHLAAHLDMRAVLTAQQVATYDRLRGYGAGESNRAHNHHGHGSRAMPH